MIVPLYKSKGERTVCRNYRGISLESLIQKIYVEILVKHYVVIDGLIDDEEVGFRSGKWVCGSNLHHKADR